MGEFRSSSGEARGPTARRSSEADYVEKSRGRKRPRVICSRGWASQGDVRPVSQSASTASSTAPFRKSREERVQRRDSCLRVGERSDFSKAEIDSDDLEMGKPQHLQEPHHPDLVTFTGLDDSSDPHNWSITRKWVTTVIVGSFTFLSPMASSMMAPALETIAEEFSMEGNVRTPLTLSIFVLGYAFGPLFLGPLSEIFGRTTVLLMSNIFFAICNLACGFARNEDELIAFRFLAGLGASAPLSIGGAVIGDCWRPHERGKAIAVFSLMPLLGTAMGPLVGGFITAKTNWRWIFWAITVGSVVVHFVGFFWLHESFAPEILRRKKARLVKKTGNEELFTKHELGKPKFLRHMQNALERPFRLLLTQPIIQFLAVYMAYTYGLIYLVMSTFPRVWSSPQYYGESIGTGGLNYISLVLGYSLGGLMCAVFNDRIYRHLRDKDSKLVGRSEFRLPLAIPASMILPIGLFIYGWTAETHQYWILPNIGAFLYAFGAIIVFQCIQTYLVDAYTRYAASALAALAVLRSLCGFGFPLFAPYMYQSLGYGWGNSLLGFVALVIGIPAPLVLWVYGEGLRARSIFCTG